jgi:hypothetical protein
MQFQQPTASSRPPVLDHPTPVRPVPLHQLDTSPLTFIETFRRQDPFLSDSAHDTPPSPFLVLALSRQQCASHSSPQSTLESTQPDHLFRPNLLPQKRHLPIDSANSCSKRDRVQCGAVDVDEDKLMGMLANPQKEDHRGIIGKAKWEKGKGLRFREQAELILRMALPSL